MDSVGCIQADIGRRSSAVICGIQADVTNITINDSAVLLDIQFHRFAVIYEFKLILCVALGIHDLQLCIIGHDHDGTGDDVTERDVAVHSQCNISQFHISAVGQGISILINLQIAVGIHANELMSNLFGGCVIQILESLILICRSIQIKNLQQFAAPDTILIVMVPIQPDLLQSRCYNQQASIGGGNVIGVRNNRYNSVSTNSIDRVIILEAQFYITGHLFQNLIHIANQVCRRGNHFVGCANLLQLGGDVGQLVKQLGLQVGNTDAVGHTRCILGNQFIHPSGEVHIHSTGHSFPCIFAESTIGSNTGSDYCGIGLQTGNRRRCLNSHGLRNIDGLTGEFHSFQFLHRNARLGGLDQKSSNIHANCSNNTIFVLCHCVGCDQICASMGGRYITVIGMGVALNAVIVVGHFERIAHVQLGQCCRHIHRLIIKCGGVEVSRFCAVHNNIHLNHAGHHSKCTDRGHCIVHLVAKLSNKRQLGVSTITQFFFQVLRVSFVGNQLQDHVAALVKAKEQILNQVGCRFIAFYKSFVIEGRSAQIDSLQQLCSEDTVGIGIVPIQIDTLGIGLDHQVTDVERGFIVGVGSNCTHQVSTDVGRILAAKHNLQIAGLCDTADRIQHRLQGINNLRRQSPAFQHLAAVLHGIKQFTQSIFLTLAQANEIQNILISIRQHQLNLASQTMNTVAVNVQFCHIQAHHKAEGINVDYLAILVGENRAGGSFAIRNNRIGNIGVGRSLCNGQSNHCLCRLIIQIAGKFYGNGILTGILNG